MRRRDSGGLPGGDSAHPFPTRPPALPHPVSYSCLSTLTMIDLTGEAPADVTGHGLGYLIS